MRDKFFSKSDLPNPKILNEENEVKDHRRTSIDYQLNNLSGRPLESLTDENDKIANLCKFCKKDPSNVENNYVLITYCKNATIS